RGHVISVAAHPKTDQFCVYSGATGFRMFVFFQYQHTSSVAQHKPVAILIPRTTGGLRIIVTGRQGAGCSEATQPHRGCGHLCTTSHHDIRVTVLDHPSSEANTVSTRGTGRSQRNIGASHTVHNRQIARNHIDDGTGDGKRRHTARSFMLPHPSPLFYGPPHTSAGPDGHTATASVPLRNLQTSIAHRLDTGNHAILDKRIHPARVFTGKIIINHQVFHRCAE